MQRLKRTTWLYLLLFFSGIPALFYQIAWQRSLLTIYGVNIESVAIVVSAFMFGLGVGSLMGGVLSRYFLHRSLLLFGLFELVLCLFGFYSLSLFHWIGNITVHITYVQLLSVSFALICVPTLFMGATLPLLLAYVVREAPNVGKSVGMLYFVNTLGGATACIIVANGSMKLLGLSGTVFVAASINFVIGITALLVSQYRKPRQLEIDLAIEDETSYYQKIDTLPLRWSVSYAALAGFIALSYEIVWVRIYSFTTASRADTFATVLGFYLMGLAFGALISRIFCHQWQVRKSLSFLFIVVIASSVLGYLFIPLLAESVRYISYISTFSWLAILTTFLGITLPLICHCAVRPDQRAGVGLSYIYFANIIGATLGSVVTGFILLHYLSLGTLSVFLTLLGLCFGSLILMMLPFSLRMRWGCYAGLLFLSFNVVMFKSNLFHHVYEKLFFKSAYSADKNFVEMIENRNGILAVQSEGIVLGNGAYDGSFNTDPIHDQNNIFRAYALNAFHPAPENVLMIGLSSGSWAQVVVNNPMLKKLTIVEINPGCLTLIQHHPLVASLLKNPKVNIVIDDARHFIREHAYPAYDVVVMNTTFHWREYASNLLSADFLKMVKGILREKGVFYFNTTSSKEAFHTALTHFAYGLRFNNFVAVSDYPINFSKIRWEKTLFTYRIDGKPVIDKNKKQFDALLNAFDEALEFKSSLLNHVKNSTLVTDDNMATEW